MRNRISFWKKWRLFRTYSKTIRKLSFELETSFNARLDRANRIYTVINIPSALIEEPYNLRKEDIDNLSKTFIREYSQKLSIFLNKNNLLELYDFYEVKKVDKYSYLLVFGFSLFNSQIVMRNIYFTFFSSLIIMMIIMLIILL